MIKSDVNIVKQKGISYVCKKKKKIKYTPWIGNLFSLLYDVIMINSVFPKKFEASYKTHIEFLKDEFKYINNKKVLELGTGSGNISKILPNNNTYVGVDISEGLLKIAQKKFKKQKFNNFELFVCKAQKLPFNNNTFDFCVCNLSLNFFDDLNAVLKEIKRVLSDSSSFIGSIPVPERNIKKSTIRGELRSMDELKKQFNENGFSFKPYDIRNGALLYFKADIQ